MGRSVDGFLAYGYDLGGQYEGPLTQAPWYDADDDYLMDDFGQTILDQVRKAHGFTETDYNAEGYYERLREVDKTLGVEVLQYGYADADDPAFLLVAHSVSADWSGVVEVDLADLELHRAQEDWDGRLATAMQALGITLDRGPQWLLAASGD